MKLKSHTEKEAVITMNSDLACRLEDVSMKSERTFDRSDMNTFIRSC